MIFDPDDKEDDIKLKLTILEIYDARLSARAERKRLMLRYKLLDYKRNMENEKRKRRSKEEKDLYNRLKAFTRIMTPEDFKDFSEDITGGFSLRNKIAQLQSWRNAGLTTIDAGLKYEKDKIVRANQLQRAANSGGTRHSRTSSSASDRYLNELVGANNLTYQSATSTNNAYNSSINGSGVIKTTKKNALVPLDITHAPDYELLSPEEQKLCSNLRIRPKPYLAIKETLFRELVRSGGMLKKRTAREILKIDVNKTSKIYEFFVQQKLINKK